MDERCFFAAVIAISARCGGRGPSRCAWRWRVTRRTGTTGGGARGAAG